MELRHLKYFIVVSEELHFSKAAERLNMSQPPLSQQIKQLEEELSVKLFNRTKRSVELTSAGEYFQKEVYQLFNKMDDIIENTRNIDSGHIGQLKIAFTGTLSVYLIKLISNFRIKFPEIDIVLYHMASTDQITALQEKRIDFGFLCLPSNKNKLNYKHIYSSNFTLALHHDHPLAKYSSPIDLSKLKDESFIMAPRKLEPVYYDTIISICHEAGLYPKVNQEAEGILNILTLVSVGLGISIVSNWAKNINKDIVFKELYNTNGKIDLHLAWNEDDTTIMKNFISHTNQFLEHSIE